MTEGLTFEAVKRGLDFDQTILQEWEDNVAKYPEKLNIIRLMVGLPANPDGSLMHPEELVSSPNFAGLEEVFRASDAARDADLSISMEDMVAKFAFQSGGVQRPKPVVTKKKKKKGKRDKKGHGKRKPGEPPKSESMNFTALARS